MFPSWVIILVAKRVLRAGSEGFVSARIQATVTRLANPTPPSSAISHSYSRLSILLFNGSSILYSRIGSTWRALKFLLAVRYHRRLRSSLIRNLRTAQCSAMSRFLLLNLVPFYFQRSVVISDTLYIFNNIENVMYDNNKSNDD